MPRYFFHTFMDNDYSPDLEGTILSSPDEAHGEAITCAGEVLKDANGHFRHGRWSMRVVDEAGDTVSELSINVNKKAAG